MWNALKGYFTKIQQPTAQIDKKIKITIRLEITLS
jgi:hypothetical protein